MSGRPGQKSCPGSTDENDVRASSCLSEAHVRAAASKFCVRAFAGWVWIHGCLYRNVSGRFSTGKTSGQNRLSVRFKNECPARASLCPCLRVCPGVRDVGLVQAGEGSPGCETCPGVRAGGGVHALLNLSGRFHMSGGIVGALPQRSSGLRAMSGENLSWDMSGRWVLSQTAAVRAHVTVRAKRKCLGYTTVRAARKRWLAG